MVLFPVKRLDGRFIAYQRHHYIAVAGSGLLFYKDEVIVEDPGFYHAVSPDPEHESGGILDEIDRQRECVFDILDSKDGLAGCDFAYYRHVDQFFPRIMILYRLAYVAGRLPCPPITLMALGFVGSLAIRPFFLSFSR